MIKACMPVAQASISKPAEGFVKLGEKIGLKGNLVWLFIKFWLKNNFELISWLPFKYLINPTFEHYSMKVGSEKLSFSLLN